MNPETIRQILMALESTPEWQFLSRLMEEDQAMQGTDDDKGTMRSPIDMSDLDDVLPELHTAGYADGAAVERYQQRLSEEAVRIATIAANQGHVMPWAEAQQRAAENIGGPPASIIDRYSERQAATRQRIGQAPGKADKYAQRLAETAIEIASSSIDRGERMSYQQAEALAKRRLPRVA